MWVALAILAFLALLITVIWLLPVKVIIKNDEENQLILRYVFLFKTYGENPNPDDPLIKMLKKAGGVERLESETLRRNVRADGLRKTVSQSYSALIELLKELVALLRICTVTKLNVKIRIAEEEPDQAAIHYGLYCAATNTLMATLQSFLRIRKRGCAIDIASDFMGSKPEFRYHAELVVRFGQVLAAFWRVALAEAKRAAAEQDQPK